MSEFEPKIEAGFVVLLKSDVHDEAKMTVESVTGLIANVISRGQLAGEFARTQIPLCALRLA